ncbi:MAG: hypothetical protein NZ888_03150 [Candidatus Nitrosocaldus sp.]|nr:hypothetical protein [Candidatus Nitrosocaldus sp.]MDW8000132.1 hypothetical protein [Candidatus Nitrosocaldus sp.]
MVKPRKAPGEGKKRLTKWQLIMPVILLGVGTGVALIISQFISGKPPLQQCITSEDLSFKLHATLSVTIDGVPVEVPANIGRDEDCIRPLHTKEDGNVYVIYSRPIRFTLLDLLSLWGLSTDGYDTSIWVKGKGQQEFLNVGSDPGKVAIEDGLSIRLELRSR